MSGKSGEKAERPERAKLSEEKNKADGTKEKNKETNELEPLDEESLDQVMRDAPL